MAPPYREDVSDRKGERGGSFSPLFNKGTLTSLIMAHRIGLAHMVKLSSRIIWKEWIRVVNTSGNLGIQYKSV